MKPVRFERFIFDRMAATNLPGLSAALVRDGDIVWSRGFGLRDLEQGQPATPRTVYGIASMTKSFTCLAIMQLVEQGRLSVDDLLSDYVDVRLQADGDPVRLWHLMSHTSGLPALGYAENIIRGHVGGADNWLPIGNDADGLTFLDGAHEWAIARPGERWLYFNEGYMLLGLVIERVSGTPYPDYVRQHILEPLGMADSTFSRETLQAGDDVATPYVNADDGERVATRNMFGPILADGGLFSTVEDLARYLAMMLDGGQLDGTRVASEASIAALTESRINPPYENSAFGPYGYGYGWELYPDFLGRRVVLHGGSLGYATSNMAYLPEEGIGVAVATNSEGYSMRHLALYGLAEALGHDPDTLPFVHRERALAQLTGVYHSFKASEQLRVDPAGDFLTATVKDRYWTAKSILVPVSLDGDERIFYTLEAGIKKPVSFTVRGEAVSLTLDRYHFRRVGPLPD